MPSIIVIPEVENPERILALFGKTEDLINKYFSLLAGHLSKFPEPRLTEFEAAIYHDIKFSLKRKGHVCDLPRNFLHLLAEQKLRLSGPTMYAFFQYLPTGTVLEALGNPNFDESIHDKSRAYWESEFSNTLKDNASIGSMFILEGYLIFLGSLLLEKALTS